MLAAQSANNILYCIKRGVASWVVEMIVPVNSAPVGPYLKYCLQAWGLQHKKDVELLERFQRRPVKIIKGLEHLSYEERLVELCLSSLEKRRLEGDTAAFKASTISKRGTDLFLGLTVIGQGVIALN